MSKHAVAAPSFHLPGQLGAILWMVLAAFLLTCMNGTVKYLSQDLHPFQLVFFRALIGALFLVPWLARTGVARAFQTDRFWLYMARALMVFIGMTCMFWAIKLAPLAEATALVFSRPLFAAAFSVLVIGEIIGARRWAATFVGFLGVMVMLRPGFAAIETGMVLALLTAMLGGFSVNITKIISRTEQPDAMTLYFLVPLVPLSVIPAALFWTAPTLEQWALIGVMAAFGAIGQRCFARAFKGGDVSVIVPLDFLRLPFAAAIGFILFGDLPLIWTWIGGSVIFAASVYIAQRGARAKAQHG